MGMVRKRTGGGERERGEEDDGAEAGACAYRAETGRACASTSPGSASNAISPCLLLRVPVRVPADTLVYGDLNTVVVIPQHCSCSVDTHFQFSSRQHHGLWTMGAADAELGSGSLSEVCGPLRHCGFDIERPTKYQTVMANLHAPCAYEPWAIMLHTPAVYGGYRSWV